MRALRNVGWAALPAVVVTAALATSVSAHRASTRVSVLPRPLPSDSLQLAVALPEAVARDDSAVVIIARVRNRSDRPVRLLMTFDGNVLAREQLVPGGLQRLDGAARLVQGGVRDVEFTSDHAGWELMSLDVAAAYWAVDGPLGLAIVPASATRVPLVSPLALFPVAIGLWWLGTRPHPARRGILAILSRAVAALALLVLGTGLLVTWLTPVDVRWAPATFLALAVLVYAPRLSPMASRGSAFARATLVHAAAAPAGVFLRRQVVPLLPHAAVVAFVLWSLAGFYVSGLGLTRLIAFGEMFEPYALPALRAVPHAIDEGGSGYDGQFYAQMALEPLLRDRASFFSALDSPSYRARRILFSATAYVAGLGRPQWIVHVYAVQNIVCWLVLAVVLLRWLPPRSPRQFAAWTACLLGQGLLSSVRFALPDGPSLLLVALAVMAVEQGRGRLGALIVGLAGTGRETSLCSAGVVVQRGRGLRSIAELSLRAAIVVLPLLAWMLYLRRVGYGASTGVANFGAPLSAYIEKWAVTLRELHDQGWQSFARFSLLTLVGLTTQAVVLSSRWHWKAVWWRAGVPYVGLLLVLGPAVWEGYPGAATRVLLPLTIAFNVLLPSSRWFWPLWLLGNLNMLHGLEVIRAPWISAHV